MQIERTCSVCGKKFLTERASGRYPETCSPECRRNRYRAYQHWYYSANRNELCKLYREYGKMKYQVHCLICGKVVPAVMDSRTRSFHVSCVIDDTRNTLRQHKTLNAAQRQRVQKILGCGVKQFKTEYMEGIE